jgi:hypothetical protein
LASKVGQAAVSRSQLRRQEASVITGTHNSVTAIPARAPGTSAPQSSPAVSPESTICGTHVGVCHLAVAAGGSVMMVPS